MELVMGGLNGVFLETLLTQSHPRSTLIRAAVAYTDGNHRLFDHCKHRAVRLEFYGLLNATDAVPLSTLELFLAQGAARMECRLVHGRYHPKVIWWRGFGAYIGSANLTSAAWTKNVECGVFFDDDELRLQGLVHQLDDLFSYVRGVSMPLTQKLYQDLLAFSREQQRQRDLERDLSSRLERLVGPEYMHRGISTFAPKGERVNVARTRFVKEWRDTLELLRSLAREFEKQVSHPSWVDTTAPLAVIFDQFLHAYYYTYIRKGLGEEEELEDADSEEQVDRAHEIHKGDPQAALREAVAWWEGLDVAPDGEDVFISETSQQIRSLLSADALPRMTEESFIEAFGRVHAFRMHARQMKNTFFNLPLGHKESIEARSHRLGSWLWKLRTTAGHDIRDLLSFVLYADTPPNMEDRLWMATQDEEWRLPHFGKSSLGEGVGWARPTDYPPRNNRTNKALKALGYPIDVE